MPVFVVKEDTLSIEKSREIYVSYIKFFSEIMNLLYIYRKYFIFYTFWRKIKPMIPKDTATIRREKTG